MGISSLSLRTLFLGLVMVVAGAPSFLVPAAPPVPAHLQVERQIHRSLASMSTGFEPDAIVAGGDARSRNALIPLVGGARVGLAAYQPMVPGSASYATALQCLTQAIYYEAANEPERGKLAVGQVVMNRMRHPAYPNSVCGVVYEGANLRVCQFSFTCDGALLRTPLASRWQESRAIARRILSGEQLREVGTATHYHADYVVPRWAYTLEKLKVIGAHIFYRFPGSPGRNVAFTARWSGREAIPALDWSRLASRLDADEELTAIPEGPQFVPGLTVVPDITDRHEPSDVGGRLDTTKEWRLSIPDPVASQRRYEAMLQAQAAASQETDVSAGGAAQPGVTQ